MRPASLALLGTVVWSGCDQLLGVEETETEKPTVSDTEPDTDVDADADGDADTDGTISLDTGTYLLWYEARVQTTDGVMTGGSWGTIFTDIADLPSFDNLLCNNTGTWTWGGDAPSMCPDCDWAFYTLTTDTVAEGPDCADVGRVGGEWDGFDHSWGFSELYLYHYARYEIPLEKVLWYYYDGGGYWFFLAYNYAGYGYNEGDATDMVARRNYGYGYYYHLP